MWGGVLSLSEHTAHSGYDLCSIAGVNTSFFWQEGWEETEGERSVSKQQQQQQQQPTMGYKVRVIHVEHGWMNGEISHSNVCLIYANSSNSCHGCFWRLLTSSFFFFFFCTKRSTILEYWYTLNLPPVWGPIISRNYLDTVYSSILFWLPFISSVPLN